MDSKKLPIHIAAPTVSIESIPPTELASFPASWRRVRCGAEAFVTEGMIVSVPVIPHFELEDPVIGRVVIRGALLARKDGRLRAYANLCRHIPLALDMGDGDVASADGRYFLCNHHGALYRIDDGRCEVGPCDGDALYPLGIEIDDGELVIAIPPEVEGPTSS